ILSLEFKSGRHRLGAIVAEQLLRALGDRQQPDDALLGLDDPAFPLRQLDPEWLGKPAHNIENQGEALRLPARGALFILIFLFILLGRLFVLTLRVVRSFDVRALERPEEQRREPGILFYRPGGAVA